MKIEFINRKLIYPALPVKARLLEFTLLDDNQIKETCEVKFGITDQLFNKWNNQKGIDGKLSEDINLEKVILQYAKCYIGSILKDPKPYKFPEKILNISEEEVCKFTNFENLPDNISFEIYS